MTKKCKFEVEVTYNSDYFAEGEIRETIKKAIRELSNEKEKKFGRLKLCDPGKTNHGMTCNIESKVIVPKKPQVYIEEIAEFSELMNDEVVNSKIVLPDAKVEELLKEVKVAFNQ